MACNYQVTSFDDSGVGTLRSAIIQSNSCSEVNTITFQVFATGTIALASTLPAVSGQLTIIGSGVERLTITGNGTQRLFTVSATGNLTLRNLTITGGRAAAVEAGGFLVLGTLAIERSVITGHVLTGTQNVQGAAGGAIMVRGGALTVTETTISGNRASAENGYARGAAIAVNGGSLTITRSALYDNSAEGQAEAAGGAVSVDNASSVIITNTTLARNAVSSNGARLGSALHANRVTSATLTNVTIADNTGAPALSPAMSQVTVRNSILARNPQGNCSARVTDGGFNLSSDATCVLNLQTSRNGVDPLLDPAGLRDNGGVTQTIALLPPSPAIDAGGSAICFTAAPRGPAGSDQRGMGHKRVCDAGAYEYQLIGQTTTLALVTPTPTSVGQPIVVVANVAVGAGPPAGGTISISSNGQEVVSGARLDTPITLPPLPSGTHTLVATYTPAPGEQLSVHHSEPVVVLIVAGPRRRPTRS